MCLKIYIKFFNKIIKILNMYKLYLKKENLPKHIFTFGF